MSWTIFPVERGQRITAAMLNELRDACDERGITVPSAFVAGHSTRSVGTALASLMANIKTSVGNGTGSWYWLQSYTDIYTWSQYQLTTGSTTSTKKNVFELAFGTSDTDWRQSAASGHVCTADLLNDIYSVLRVLKTLIVASTSGDLYKNDRASASESSCAASLTSLDSASFSSFNGLLQCLVDNVGIHDVELITSFSVASWAYRGLNRKTFSLAQAADAVYVGGQIRSGRYYHASAFSNPETATALAREIPFELRGGTDSPPSNWTDAQTYGDSVASLSVDASSPVNTNVNVLIPDSLLSSGSRSYLFTAGSIDSSGSLLCAIDDPGWYTLEHLRAYVSSMLVNYTYDKPAA